MLAVAWFGIVRSPTDHLAAAPLDSAPTTPQPEDDRANPSAPVADTEAPQPPSPDDNTAPPDAPAATAFPAPGISPRFAEMLCKELGGAALENGLPAEFFVRLIWQESRFHPRSVSRKGARGIAQFMPATARSRGLANPFEPVQSLHQSARLLKELREQFGNLGLAAAAYNSGPRRVQDWLDGRAKLPGETRDYVKIITGRTAEEWVKLGSDAGTKDFFASVIPCNEIPKVLAREPHPLPEESAEAVAKVAAQGLQDPFDREPNPVPQQSTDGIARVAAREPHPSRERDPNTSSEQNTGAITKVVTRETYPSPERALNPFSEQGANAEAVSVSGSWGLQLTGNWSEEQALAAYRDLQQKFPTILGDRPPLVLRSQMPGRGPAPWYRVRVTESSRERAEALCARLEQAGGNCLVFRN